MIQTWIMNHSKHNCGMHFCLLACFQLHVQFVVHYIDNVVFEIPVVNNKSNNCSQCYKIMLICAVDFLINLELFIINCTDHFGHGDSTYTLKVFMSLSCWCLTPSKVSPSITLHGPSVLPTITINTITSSLSSLYQRCTRNCYLLAD